LASGSGHLDVLVHNAGHLYVGYVEAFTAQLHLNRARPASPGRALVVTGAPAEVGEAPARDCRAPSVHVAHGQLFIFVRRDDTAPSRGYSTKCPRTKRTRIEQVASWPSVPRWDVTRERAVAMGAL